MASTKQVVVVGCGQAGFHTAHQLIKQGLKGSITVVQSQPFYEVPFFMPVFIRDPEKYEATANTKGGAVATIDHTNIEGCKYVVGTVTGISETPERFLTIDGKNKLQFDALVLCVGIHYPVLAADLGQDFMSRKEYIKSFKGKVEAAKHILIGGGGPVACEMAAEARLMNSSCKITLVCSQAAPLAHWTGGGRAALDDRFKNQNIEVICNEKLETTDMSLEPGTYKLSSGKTLDADVYLPFFGKARTQFLEADMLEGDRVKVNTHGQSLDKKSVFAVGCSNKYRGVNMATIEKEAIVVAANVAAFLKDAALPQSLPDKAPGPPDVMWVHLGLGQYSIMNLAVAGPVPGCIGRCCGCCNPLCPCCACLGYCCLFPASKLQSQCMECMYLKMMGNPVKPHAAKAPEMQTMGALEQ